MTSKHTPGNWFITRSSLGVHKYVEARIGGGMVQEIACCGPTEQPEQSEANARLIAAAPDLLEALRFLLPHVAHAHADNCGDSDSYNNAEVQTCGCGLDSAVESAHEAIAKATGEG